MSQVKAGVFIHPTGEGPTEKVYEETLELIRIAEEVGIHTAWVSQLHFQTFRARLSSPFPFLVKAAEHTKKIQLATGVVTLPFENPLRLAEDAAVTNLLLKGRLSFGVGAGEPVAEEFEPFGVPFDERHQRAVTGLSKLLKALRGEPLPPTGAFLQPPGNGLDQRVWWASGSRERSVFAAREGVNLLLNVDQGRWELPISQTNAEAAEAFRSAWTRPHEPRIGIWRIVFPWDNEEEALERYWQITQSEALVNLKRGLTKQAKTLDELRERHQSSQLLIKGHPDNIVKVLRAEEERIGFTDFLFYFTFAGLKFDEKVTLLKRLAHDVAGPLGWLRPDVRQHKTHAPEPAAAVA
ncbi:MAG: hypothetical protein B9S32_01060 [Verrucomicrobia bacterium Tous-C9LFEB]|nr:MAG: hypothetical protein B9S32_01060 [Verrucomicrobia bacterium Tous-C9LFEB]